MSEITEISETFYLSKDLMQIAKKHLPADVYENLITDFVLTLDCSQYQSKEFLEECLTRIRKANYSILRDLNSIKMEEVSSKFSSLIVDFFYYLFPENLTSFFLELSSDDTNMSDFIQELAGQADKLDTRLKLSKFNISRDNLEIILRKFHHLNHITFEDCSLITEG